MDIKNINNKYFLFVKVFILIYLFGSFISHLLRFYDYVYYPKITFAINLLFEIVLVFIFISQGVTKKFIYLISALILCYLIGQYALNFDFLDFKDLKNEFFKGDIYQLNNYLFIFLFYSVTHNVFKKNLDSKIQINSIFIVLKNIVFFNGLFILIGVFFDLEIFKSYANTERFGYKGFFFAHTHLQFLYAILTIWIYKKSLKDSKYLYDLVFIVILSFLLGKKSSILFIILLLVYHLSVIAKHKKYYRIIFLIIGVLSYVFRYHIVKQFINWFPFWKKFDINKQIYTILSSGRDLRFNSFKKFVDQEWNIVNYFFGGVNFPSSRVEMALIDLFMFFGVIGSLIYILGIIKIHKNINKKDLLLVLSIIIIALLTGSFFVNISLTTLYCLLLFQFKKDITLK